MKHNSTIMLESLFIPCYYRPFWHLDKAWSPLKYEARPILHLTVFAAMILPTPDLRNFDEQVPPVDASTTHSALLYIAVGSKLCDVFT